MTTKYLVDPESSFQITFLVCAGRAAIGILASLVHDKGEHKHT